MSVWGLVLMHSSNGLKAWIRIFKSTLVAFGFEGCVNHDRI